MTSDQRLLISKIRRLSIALAISGALNIGVLALLTYVLTHYPRVTIEMDAPNGKSAGEDSRKLNSPPPKQNKYGKI